MTFQLENQHIMLLRSQYFKYRSLMNEIKDSIHLVVTDELATDTDHYHFIEKLQALETEYCLINNRLTKPMINHGVSYRPNYS